MRMKKIYWMTGISLGLILVFVLIHKVGNAISLEKKSTLVINEICDNNFSTAPLRYRENVDWIELINVSEAPLDLYGWMISDDTDDMDKYIFPSIEIGAGETLLLYATGDGVVTEEGVFLNFKLSTNEKLSLANPKGEVIDSVVIPEIKQNTSYARRTDASEEWCNANPSPDTSNNGAEPLQEASLKAPVFSVSGGFYSGMVALELSGSNEMVDIFYTLDGSEPTQESYWYSEPIIIYDKSAEANVLSARSDISKQDCYRYAPEGPVDKITVVRAVAIDKEGNKSEVVTNSYVVDIHGKDTYQDMAIVSLSLNPEDFFDYENGLYILGNEYVAYMELGEEAEGEEPKANYELSGRKTEKAANIEVYGANQELLLNQKVGIRVRGNATRRLSQKSFSIFAREMYDGKEAFDNDIFGNGETYRKIRLLTDADETKIRHELHAQLLKDSDVMTQDYIRCNVFLNGEYWGVYSLVQAYDEQYIHNQYNIPIDEIEFNENLLPEELMELVENEAGLTDDKLYDTLLERIDVKSYIDYYASMIYIDHYDWLHYNGYMWKSTKASADNPYQDGKWRWMLYDTERCENDYEANTFTNGLVNNWHDDPIANVLMKNEEFREQFVTGFMDLANTVFKKENVYEQMDRILATYSQAIEAQGIRWGDDWADEVYEELDEIREFYDKRFEYITGYLKEEFSLVGEPEVVRLETSDAEKGKIKINTVIPEFENNQWEGRYFSDYSVTLTAIELQKDSFAGWYGASGELISKDNSIVVPINSENYYRALFE